MRFACLVIASLLPLPAVAETPEDDPKLARRPPALATPAASLPGEDDPKLARGTVVARAPIARHVAPRFKLAYRWLTAANLEPGEVTFHAAELDYYPSSFRYFRFGLDTEFGWAGGPYSLWYFTVGPTVGFQFPWRVTPFVDARFVAGLAGGSVDGIVAVSYMYTGGLETGVELYLAGRAYVTAAIGWAHPVYRGADVAYVRAHPGVQAVLQDRSDDSLTFKVGLGF